MSAHVQCEEEKKEKGKGEVEGGKGVNGPNEEMTSKMAAGDFSCCPFSSPYLTLLFYPTIFARMHRIPAMVVELCSFRVKC